jgi:ribulose-5-phosphate 4-epimerase/fuculose-1-phosphate aldolase
MKSIVVGGNFGETPKASSVALKLSEQLNSDLINGGSINELRAASLLTAYDLIIWAVNVDNEVEKIYPIKKTGAVLICTKAMRESSNLGSAVSRIFKMNANAVISIDTSITPFYFYLIDALGNNWCSTPYTDVLAAKIQELYDWSKGSIRIKSTPVKQITTQLWNNSQTTKNTLDHLCDIVKTVADKVELERGGRYFGNVSTRCAKMFPSVRRTDDNDLIAVSARNTPKDRIRPEDFVFTELGDNEVYYEGDRKPSVDTPVQLHLYQKLKHINFMIHGHAYIQGAPFTEHYYPCGDLREVEAIEEIIDDQKIAFRINLRNHGFLIAASDLIALRHYAETATFTYRGVGEEKKS